MEFYIDWVGSDATILLAQGGKSNFPYFENTVGFNPLIKPPTCDY